MELIFVSFFFNRCKIISCVYQKMFKTNILLKSEYLVCWRKTSFQKKRICRRIFPKNCEFDKILMSVVANFDMNCLSFFHMDPT